VKRRQAVPVDKHARATDAPSEPVPELPAWKAFVVQFSRETGSSSGTLSGRVEHLSSGRRGRFNSAEQLVTILEKLLAEVGMTSERSRSRE